MRSKIASIDRGLRGYISPARRGPQTARFVTVGLQSFILAFVEIMGIDISKLFIDVETLPADYYGFFQL